MDCDSNREFGNSVPSSSSSSSSSVKSTITPIDPLMTQTNIVVGTRTNNDSSNSVEAIQSDPSRPVRLRRPVRLAPKSSPKERLRSAIKWWRVRKNWEKEYDKNRALPGPFVAVHVNDKRDSMQSSLILIFALIQCICGFVFPICDAFALTDTRTIFAVNHKYYLEIFLLSQYVGAISWLAYLQILIWYYGGAKDITTMTNENGQPVSHADGTSTPPDRINEQTAGDQSNGNPENRSQHCRNEDQFSFGLVDQRNGAFLFRNFTHHSIEKKSIIWHEEGMNLYLRLGAVGFGLGVMIHDGFNLSSAWELDEPSCHSKIWIPKHVLRLIWVLWQTYFVFKYHRLGMNVHKFVVRLAFTHLAVVNLCHWLKTVISEISETLKRADMISDSQTGSIFGSNWTTDTNTTHPYAYQTTDHRNANLCEGHLGETVKPYLYPLAIEYSLITGTLFYKMLRRVGENIPNKIPTFPSCTSLLTGRLADDQCSNFPWAPSVVSFSELSTPNLIQAQNLTPGQYTDDVDTKRTTCRKHTSYRQLLGCRVYLPTEEQIESNEENHSIKDHSGYEIRTRLEQSISIKRPSMHHTNDSYCHRSHTGLFLGLMLFLACTIGVIFTVSRGRITFDKLIPHLYQYSKIAMLSVSMVACLLALLQTHAMKFRPIKAGENFEYNLLGIGLIGCLTYHMLLFVPSLETVVHAVIYHSNDAQSMQESVNPVAIKELHGTALVYLVKCTLEVFQALLQFFFIVESSRRGPCCTNQALIKPGRSAIVFLLINNLSLWLMNTFEFRESEYQLTLHRQYYGIRAWSVITCCFIPLIIFFRFHSTVCLAQIWSKLYEFH